MASTIQISVRRLAEIAERSPGYTVVAVEGGQRYTISEIAFDRRNGCRNRAVVVCVSNGRPARFNSDDLWQVED